MEWGSLKSCVVLVGLNKIVGWKNVVSFRPCDRLESLVIRLCALKMPLPIRVVMNLKSRQKQRVLLPKINISKHKIHLQKTHQEPAFTVFSAQSLTTCIDKTIFLHCCSLAVFHVSGSLTRIS